MPRYIVRFKGTGKPPAAARERIREHPDAAVVDEDERMLLIDAPEKVARQIGEALPDWAVTGETSVPLPENPRPKLRKR